MGLEVITRENYESFKKSNKALIIATASWCPPCESYKPEVEKYLESHPDVKAGYVDVDEPSAFFKKDFEVKALPDTVVIKDGKIIGMFYGRFLCSELEEGLREYFG